MNVIRFTPYYVGFVDPMEKDKIITIIIDDGDLVWRDLRGRAVADTSLSPPVHYLFLLHIFPYHFPFCLPVVVAPFLKPRNHLDLPRLSFTDDSIITFLFFYFQNPYVCCVYGALFDGIVFFPMIGTIQKQKIQEGWRLREDIQM